MSVKITKQTIGVNGIALVMAGMLGSCTVINSSQSAPEYMIDPVCGMKVDKAEAYTSKYKDNKYYFDNYNCKQSFKMNPEKFLQTNCAEIK